MNFPRSGNDAQDIEHSGGYLQKINAVAEGEGFLRTTAPTRSPTPAPRVGSHGLRHSGGEGEATHIKSMYELIDAALLDASVPDAAAGMRDDDDVSKAKAEHAARASPLWNPWAKP